MHVAVNGWFWNHPATGSGRYTRRVAYASAIRDPALALSVLLPPAVQGAGEASFDQPLPPNLALVDAGAVGRAAGPYPSRLPSDLVKVWWEQVAVPRLARRLGADVLHVPYWASPVVTPVPTVVTIHDIIPRVLPAYRGSPKVRLYTALVSATARRALHILTDSEAARRDILRYLHIPPTRVHTAPLAADEAYRPEPGDDDGVWRARLGLPPSYMLYLGGFDVRKNVRALCRAFNIVHHARPDVPLVIGGRLPERDSSFTPDPRRLAREAGLDADSVFFPGFVPEAATPALYRGARLFIWPSVYEGFGLPPLEALSCGTPVVGADTTSLPDIVGDAGVLLLPEDIEGFAGAMLQLWIDDAFHRDLSARAVVRARSFSWDRTAQATLQVYRAAV